MWNILRTAGINPNRDRTGPTWSEFIHSQAAGIIATDFACVDTATVRRFHVLFAIEMHSGRVHLGGITTNPTGPWNTQAARNLLIRFRDAHGLRYTHRPHRSLSQRAPDDGDDIVAIGPGQPIRRHTTCGGLINEYRHAA